MPRRHWLPIIMLGGLLAALLAHSPRAQESGEELRSHVPEAQGTVTESPSGEGARDGKAEWQTDVSDYSITLPLGVLSQTKPFRCDICGEQEKQREADDLVAQRSMAASAEQTVNVGWGQVGVAVVALFLLWLTYRETRRNAIAAENAATASLRAADVSERALADLERPHLFIENVRAAPPITRDWYEESFARPFFHVVFDVKNYGKTPAIVKRMCGQVFYGAELPNPPKYHEPDIHENETVIGPGDFRASSPFYRGTITPEMVGQLYSGRTYHEGIKPTRLWLIGFVTYESVTGVKDEVGFCWEYRIGLDRLIQTEMPGYTYRKRDIKT